MYNKERLLEKIKELLKEGVKLGINITELETKINNVEQMMNGGKVSIALMGSISDGKTTTVAALLGQLFEDMKIDEDESSDELKVYHPVDMDDRFEIIDTPGLWGTSEKECENKIVRLSEITLRYLSEANIVVYVSDAKNPLKNSHRPIIQKIMRDLNKLPVSIFVINKMDETGCDLLDEEDYGSMCAIKTDTLKNNLVDCLNLNQDEVNNLKICCISADPKRSGLEYWLQYPDDYNKRSHIDQLRAEIKAIQSLNTSKVLNNSVIASIKEIMAEIDGSLECVTKPIEESLTKTKELSEDLRLDRQNLWTDLQTMKKEAEHELRSYRQALVEDVRSASLETIESILDRKIGLAEGRISFTIVKGEIDRIFGGLYSKVSNKINTARITFERKFHDQERFMEDSIQEGVKLLKSIKINNKQVLSVRNIVNTEYKFKPYGAVKTAAKITKAFVFVGTGVEIAMDVWKWRKEKKATKEMEGLKSEIIKGVDGIIDDAINSLSNDNFLKNFGSEYNKLKEQIESRDKEIAGLQSQLSELKQFKKNIQMFWEESAQSVEYEEIYY